MFVPCLNGFRNDESFMQEVTDCSPLVTIVIPVFNVEKYISQCLESVLAQSYENLEVICIDDCGSDSSVDILSGYIQADRRIRLIKHNKNLGLGPARNTGLKKARGEYIYFLDSDDWIEKDTIGLMVKQAIDTKADVVIASAEAFPDEEKEDLKDEVKRKNEWLDVSSALMTIDGQRFDYAIRHIPCTAWGKLYKTEFLLKNKLFFINRKVLHEDNGFHLKVMSCEPTICSFEKRLYKYRIRSSSLMSFGAKEGGSDKAMAIALEDAMVYLRSAKKASWMIQVIKDVYWKHFLKSFCGFAFFWGRSQKRLSLCGISVFKQTVTRKNKTKITLLGIPLYIGK